jgi:DNA-binding response OmpR family regulator
MWQKENMPSANRVLVIDDNTDLIRIISIILSTEGFLVKVCYTIEDRLFYLQDWKPNVLLLDVNINGEDARDFFYKLATKERETIKIILMSGDETLLSQKEQWNTADDFIVKPFDSDLLIKKVSKCLSQQV